MSVLDRLARETALPGIEDELHLVLQEASLEEEGDEGPVDESGYRRHTASTLLARRPMAYALIPKLAEEGVGVRGICRVLNVSPHTVSAVIASEAGSRTVSMWRSDFSRRMRGTAALALARANELLSDEGAVREAGIKGVSAFLRDVCKAIENLRDAERDVDADEVAPEDADVAGDYVRQLKAAPGGGDARQ